MKKSNQYPRFQECPRCGMRGLEVLETHAHCANCNYAPGIDNIEAQNAPQGFLPEVIDLIFERERKTAARRTTHPVQSNSTAQCG